MSRDDLDTGMKQPKDRIVTGDALEELSKLSESSIHTCVTDPPYGMAFMSRGWDDFEPKEYQEWCEVWAREVKRVLKPGGHLLAFSGNRTHHRLFTGVEDAGFELRDTLTWHYGNGFPKNTDTLLKPATEFAVLARRPFDGSAADCFEEHGTAHLNVDECRLPSDDGTDRSGGRVDGDGVTDFEMGMGDRGGSDEGRYPANVVFDGVAAERLDNQTGDLEPPGGPAQGGEEADFGYQGYDGQWTQGDVYPDDSGGASRFYYTAKASKAERTLNGRIENSHPTVKPLDLMEWLVTLVSHDDQVVVDPFCGTGTTCSAAKDLGRHYVGIEKNPRWADVARVRCGRSPTDPSHVRGDGGQAGIETYTDGGET